MILCSLLPPISFDSRQSKIAFVTCIMPMKYVLSNQVHIVINQAIDAFVYVYTPSLESPFL